MANLPTKDEAVYTVINDILQNEPNPMMAEFLCLALLAGFQKVDDLTNVIQQSANPEQSVGLVQQATALMSYDRTQPQNY